MKYFLVILILGLSYSVKVDFSLGSLLNATYAHAGGVQKPGESKKMGQTQSGPCDPFPGSC